MAVQVWARSSHTAPMAITRGVKRASGLSWRSSKRCSARKVNIRSSACAHLPPVLLVRWVMSMRNDPDDVFSTVQLLASMLFFPIWQIILAVIIGANFGWVWALLSILLLPLAGLSVRSFARRRNQALREAWVFLTLPFQGRKHRLLVREKQRLQTELAAVAQALAQSGDTSA